MSFVSLSWILLSIISTSLYLVWTSAFLKKNPRIGISSLIIWSNLCASLVIILVAGNESFFEEFSRLVLLNVVIVGFLNWIGKLLYSFAYSRTTVANVTVFSALTPVYAACLAPFLGYEISTKQILGILVISTSILLFFLGKIRGVRSEKFSLSSVVVIGSAVLSTFPAALAIYYQKEAIVGSSPLLVSFMMCLFSVFASSLIILVKPALGRFKIESRVIPDIIKIGVFQALAIVAFSQFISSEHPAVGQSLQRISSLVQIFFAHYLLNERLDTRWHMACVCVSLLGIFILAF